jgi:hypothetical protein
MDPYGILPYLKPHFATKKITIWVIAKKDRKKKGEKKIGNSPFWVIATSKKDRKKNKKKHGFFTPPVPSPHGGSGPLRIGNQVETSANWIYKMVDVTQNGGFKQQKYSFFV